MNNEYIVTIKKLVYGGKAYTQLKNGRDCYITGDILPNERAKIKIIKKKKKYNECLIIKRLSSSINRKKPKCQYFEQCNGCFLQNLEYTKQLETKQNYTQEVFDVALGTNSIKLLSIIPASSQFNYRHKIVLNFYTNVDGQIQLGYYHNGLWFRAINLKTCLLFDNKLEEILNTTRIWAKKNKLSAFHQNEKKGLLRNLTIRKSQAYDQWMIAIVTSEEEFESNIWQDLIATLQKIINLKSLYWRMAPAITEHGKVHYDTHIWGDKFITEKLANLDFQISFGDFFQNNVEQANNMIKYIIKNIQPTSSSHILDLYTGVGTFSLPIANAFNTAVTGIEIVKTAITSAKKNAEINNINNINFICKDVNTILSKTLHKNIYDIIIVDPPRAGLKKIVLKDLLKAKPQQIIYISCNPETLARDLSLLQKIYTIKEIQPFDLFAQTYHTECIALLELAKK